VEKDNRFYIIVIVILFVLACAIGIGGYCIGKAHNGIDVSAGRELDRASEINRAVGESQQRRLEDNRESVRSLEALRAIALERDRTYKKLGELNRGSKDIPKAIREETLVLEDFIGSVDYILSNYADTLGNK